MWPILFLDHGARLNIRPARATDSPLKDQMMKTSKVMLALLLPIAISMAQAEQTPSSNTLERGRYLVAISGCNDCHTPGYAQTGGNVPEDDWLTGNPVGFQGPWGTTYPANLRLRFDQLSEDEWMTLARTPMRPPMPWFALRDMNDSDLKAVYGFIRSLGPKGEPAPVYAGPGVPAKTLVIEFVPKENVRGSLASR